MKDQKLKIVSWQKKYLLQAQAVVLENLLR